MSSSKTNRACYRLRNNNMQQINKYLKNQQLNEYYEEILKASYHKMHSNKITSETNLLIIAE